MRIYKEDGLRDFEFWSGALDLADQMSNEDFDAIESELEQLYPDGMSETELNDLFWHDGDFVCRLLGYDDQEAFERRNEEDE